MSVALRKQDVVSIEKEAQCWYLEGGEANSANYRRQRSFDDIAGKDICRLRFEDSAYRK